MWKQLFFRAIDAAEAQPLDMLGTCTDPRQCCFCHRTSAEPGVTFNKEAHVVPQAIGNKGLMSWEECDDCNARGSKSELELANVLDGARMVSLVGKKAEWMFRRASPNSGSIRVRPRERALHIEANPNDPHVSFRWTQDGARIEVQLKPFRPYIVGQSLARIAWFVMPPELRRDNDHIRRWLIGERLPASGGFAFRKLKGAPGSFLPGPLISLRGWSTDRAQGNPPSWFDLRLGLGNIVLSTTFRGPLASSAKGAPPDDDGQVYAGTPDDRVAGVSMSFRVVIPAFADTPPLCTQDIAEAAFLRSLARAPGDGDPVSDWLEAEQDLWWRERAVMRE